MGEEWARKGGDRDGLCLAGAWVKGSPRLIGGEEEELLSAQCGGKHFAAGVGALQTSLLPAQTRLETTVSSLLLYPTPPLPPSQST